MKYHIATSWRSAPPSGPYAQPVILQRGLANLPAAIQAREWWRDRGFNCSLYRLDAEGFLSVMAEPSGQWGDAGRLPVHWEFVSDEIIALVKDGVGRIAVVIDSRASSRCPLRVYASTWDAKRTGPAPAPTYVGPSDTVAEAMHVAERQAISLNIRLDRLGARKEIRGFDHVVVRMRTGHTLFTGRDVSAVSGWVTTTETGRNEGAWKELWP